ncbi:MAG: hypothetical protein KGZ83_17450, partial [Sulfuricella sp.]|nr:hypothetical protein [Sulfuricella sp.]
MKKINQYIGKNETRYSYGGGKFFLLFYAITPVTVSFFKDSRSVGSAENVQGGLSAWIDYDEVRIESVVAQEIGFFMSGSEVRYQLEQSKSYVTVQDFLAAVILVEPEIKGLDEEISAFMLLVDVWNVPTLEAIVLAEENLSGALNETAHALAML